MKKFSILIFVLLLISSSGCISNESESDGLHIYLVEYNEDYYILNETGYTLAENLTIIQKNISTLNISKIYFTLSWEDTHEWPPRDNTRVYVPYWEEPDTFSLSVKAPIGINITFLPSSNEENTSFSGKINITCLTNDVPENETLHAESYNDAFDQIKNCSGFSIWEINITCVASPGTGPGGFMGPAYDMGNDWDLVMEVYYFNAKITMQK